MHAPESIPDFVLTTDVAKAAIVARCGCGKEYTADGWEDLKQLGERHIPACEDGPAYDLSLANCSCGSTLSWRVLPECWCGKKDEPRCSCGVRQDYRGDLYNYTDRYCTTHGVEDRDEDR